VTGTTVTARANKPDPQGRSRSPISAAGSCSASEYSPWVPSECQVRFCDHANPTRFARSAGRPLAFPCFDFGRLAHRAIGGTCQGYTDRPGDRAGVRPHVGRRAAKKHKVSDQTINVWRKHFAGLAPAHVKRLKALELENVKLKRLFAERDLDVDVMREINRKNGEPRDGYRRVRIFLRREGLPMGINRARRLWRQAGLALPRQRSRRRIGASRPRPPRAANHVWAHDFAFDSCANGQQLKCRAECMRAAAASLHVRRLLKSDR
jgi:hypothetical protein